MIQYGQLKNHQDKTIQLISFLKRDFKYIMFKTVKYCDVYCSMLYVVGEKQFKAIYL